MKVMYEANKGFRVKKGNTKVKGRGRMNNFSLITVKGDIWWDKTDSKWVNWDDRNYKHEFCSNYYGIRSVKAAIRHIKNHHEIPKGSLVILKSNFKGYDVYIRV